MKDFSTVKVGLT